MFEKILSRKEAELKEGDMSFPVIYELYKFEYYAFGEVSRRVLEGLLTFYENIDDRITAISHSGNLLKMCKKEGGQDLIDEAQKKVDKNIAILEEKAANYQKTGEHRFAFNSYRRH